MEDYNILTINVISHILSYLSSRYDLARCKQISKLWYSLSPSYIPKPHISFSFIGSTQVGKSTLIGHLLYKNGSVGEEKIEQNRKISQEFNNIGNEYSYVMDNSRAEREAGRSIMANMKELDLKRNQFTLVDHPGAIDMYYLLQTDYAVLVVTPSVKFRENFTIKQSKLCGREIKMVIFNLTNNKTSTSEAKEETVRTLQENGYNTSEIKFVTLNGLTGDNFSGLLTAFSNITEPKREYNQPLLMTINDSFQVSSVGVVLSGKIWSGVLKSGTKLSFAPLPQVIYKDKNNEIAKEDEFDIEVVSIEINRKPVDKAFAGDFVAFNINRTNKLLFRKGMVAGDLNYPIRAASFIIANIQMSLMAGSVFIGYRPMLYSAANSASVLFSELIAKKDRTDPTDKAVVIAPHVLIGGDEALVKLELGKPIFFTTLDSLHPKFSTFIIKSDGQSKNIIATGQVKEIIYA